jgi:hypothetical protein
MTLWVSLSELQVLGRSVRSEEFEKTSGVLLFALLRSNVIRRLQNHQSVRLAQQFVEVEAMTAAENEQFFVGGLRRLSVAPTFGAVETGEQFVGLFAHFARAHCNPFLAVRCWDAPRACTLEAAFY